MLTAPGHMSETLTDSMRLLLTSLQEAKWYEIHGLNWLVLSSSQVTSCIRKGGGDACQLLSTTVNRDGLPVMVEEAPAHFRTVSAFCH